jgi:hypothetical protein
MAEESFTYLKKSFNPFIASTYIKFQNNSFGLINGAIGTKLLTCIIIVSQVNFNVRLQKFLNKNDTLKQSKSKYYI